MIHSVRNHSTASVSAPLIHARVLGPFGTYEKDRLRVIQS